MVWPRVVCLFSSAVSERFNGLKGDTQTVNSLPLPCPSGHSMNWMKLKM